MKIGIVGCGYVGLVTAGCLAQIGHEVIAVDNDAKKIAALKKNRLPIYEPGLGQLISKNRKEGRIHFATSIRQAVERCLVIFIAVGTPSLPDGSADLTGVEYVSREIARFLKEYRLIVEKSTVPVQTGEWVERTIRTHIRRDVEFDVASNPEFLREGEAIHDFMHPDRIVLGVNSLRAAQILEQLYKPLKAKILITDVKSAELIKHASNSFLAMKISFINAIARICEAAGADVLRVAEGIGLDQRIGKAFLRPGIGYGGSCFPKDVDAFLDIAKRLGYDFALLKATQQINQQQRIFVLEKMRSALWILKDKRIGILGLAFKPNTDDIRNSPALDLISLLQQEGAKIVAYDPQAMPKAKKLLKNVTFVADPYKAARNTDCLVVVTEWDEFKELDFRRIRKIMCTPVIMDCRNIYEPTLLQRMGFLYLGVGRKT